MLSPRRPLRFENNPSFLRKIPSTCGDQIADCYSGIYPGFCKVPACKPDNLCLLIYKINIYFAPFAVAVCLIQVGCSGVFLFSAHYFFQLHIYDADHFIIDQLGRQPVHSSMVGQFTGAVSSISSPQ